MRVRLIRGVELSSDDVACWSVLQRADAQFHHPFLRPEFVEIAARTVPGIEIGILEVEGDRVGFFPFQRVSRIEARPVAWQLSDMHGVVVRPDVPWRAEDLLRQCGLAAWHFDHLVASQGPFRPFHHALDNAAYVDLRDGFERYRRDRAGSGSSILTAAARKARKLAREIGPLRFEWHTSAPRVLESLMDWKQQQIVASHGLDVFRLPWVAGLLDRLRQSASPGLTGVLSALYAGEQLVAVHLGLQSGDVLSSWIPTYNPAYTKYSPGMILHVDLIERAAAEGVGVIDLGRGSNQLKARLQSGVVPLAIGSVELRPIRRLLRAGWYGTRRLVYRTPLRKNPLRWYRRVRSWVTSNT